MNNSATICSKGMPQSPWDFNCNSSPPNKFKTFVSNICTIEGILEKERMETNKLTLIFSFYSLD